MPFFKKEEKKPDIFWREYEEKTGEKVLTRGLGRYISGWNEFDEKKWNNLWGLLVNTSGGFRFHHFPKNSWIDALAWSAEKTPPKEKTFFLPKEKIISSELIKETKWWKKLFSSCPPYYIVIYKDETEREKQLVFEADYGL